MWIPKTWKCEEWQPGLSSEVWNQSRCLITCVCKLWIWASNLFFTLLCLVDVYLTCFLYSIFVYIPETWIHHFETVFPVELILPETQTLLPGDKVCLSCLPEIRTEMCECHSAESCETLYTELIGTCCTELYGCVGLYCRSSVGPPKFWGSGSGRASQPIIALSLAAFCSPWWSH